MNSLDAPSFNTWWEKVGKLLFSPEQRASVRLSFDAGYDLGSEEGCYNMGVEMGEYE